jgi:hypothetical protein
MALDFNAFNMGSQAVGDPVNDVLQRQQGMLSMQAQSLQNQAARQNLQLQNIALQRQQTFGQDMQSFLANPNATGVAALMGKYPEFQKQIQDSWSMLDTAQRRTDATQLGAITSLLSKGQYDSAAKMLQTRIDAGKSSGRDTSQDEQALAMLNSGDPAQQKAVLGLAMTEAYGAVGPDKAAEYFNGLGLGQAPQKLGPGEALVNPLSGDKIASQNPLLQHVEVANADGSQTATTFNPETGAFGGAAVNGTPAEGGGQASGGGAASGPRSVRNNNPGNLKATPFTKSQPGYQGVDDAGYAIFDNPQNGVNAQAALLAGKGYYGGGRKTVAAIVSKWAPPKSAGGDNTNAQTANYIAYVSKQLGVKPSDVLTPQQLPQLAQAMAHFEAGATGHAGPVRVPPNSAAPSQGGAPAGAPAPVSGSPYTFGGSSGGLNTRNAPAGYAWNPTHTGLVPLPGGPADPDSGGAVLAKYNIAPGETGPSVLAKLPPAIGSQVKALAEGRLPMPSSFALAKPYWQTLLQLTSQYDPSFDAASAPARKAAITAFTGMGKGAQIVGSVNRVANHLQLLWNESHRLAGPDTGFGPLNTALAATGQAFEPQDAKAYDTEVQFIAGELEKIARNSPGTVSGVDKIISNLSRKQSASTRAAAIKAAVGIISGAVDPLKDQFNSAFTNDSARPNIPWVTPKAQQIYREIGGVDLSLTGQGADSNSSASGPTQIRSAAEYHALPSGAHYVDPNGIARIKR